MRNCAYCGQPSPQTGEHVFSSCLIERQPEVELKLRRVPERFISPHQKINDVCKECNSGRLSETDSEICRLYDEYFSDFVRAENTIDFNYNFDLLNRWLMKSSYNSIRAAREEHKDTRLRDLSGYIIGSEPPDFYFSVFVLLVTPYELKKRDKEELTKVDELEYDYLSGEREVLEPKIMGSKQFKLNEGKLRDTEIYLCIVNSYFFFTLIHSRNRYQAKSADEEFCNFSEKLTRLPDYKNSCLLTASEYDFIQAARTFGLIHTDD